MGRDGFLAPIVLLVPFAAFTSGDLAGEAGPLRSWVYPFVYGGFAVQGLLLSVAFVLYAAGRWPETLAGRDSE